jgi:hypothetical protein
MLRLVAVLSLLLVQASAPTDLITIDGAKTPEMIPQWAVWTSAFHIITASRRAGSNALQDVLGLTDPEAARLFREAEAQYARDSACGRRVERLRPLVGKEKDSAINGRTEAIQIECRWDTLRARDRLLEALRPEAQVRLSRWVEDHKAGMQVTIRKAELAHYQRPQ